MKIAYLFFSLFILTRCAKVNTTFIEQSISDIESYDESLIFNGLYVAVNLEQKHPTDHFYFYKNKMCYTPLHSKNIYESFWHDPQFTLGTLIGENATHYKGMTGWGHFRVLKDSILIQVFKTYYVLPSISKKGVIELRGEIINDSLISISEERCSWCYNEIEGNSIRNHDSSTIKKFNPPIEYRFHPTLYKPDSTEAWFFHKKWYQELIY